MGAGNLRNLPCKCGSGKKYKHCHLKIEWEEAQAKKEALKKRIQEMIMGKLKQQEVKKPVEKQEVAHG